MLRMCYGNCCFGQPDFELMVETWGPYDTEREAVDAAELEAQIMRAAGYYIDSYYAVEGYREEEGLWMWDAVIEYADEPPTPTEPPAKKKSRTALYIVGGLAATTAIGGIIYLATKKKKR